MTVEAPLLDLLQASLWRPIVLVAVAWLLLRILRVRHPASRHAVWTAVLVGMLALPVLSVMVPDLRLRVLPWTEPAPPVVESASATPAATDVDPSLASGASTSATATTATRLPQLSIETLIVAGYSGGLLVMLCSRMIGWRLIRRVIWRSRSLRHPCLRESSDVVAPIAVGLLRPVVILPATWRQWSVRTRRAVLAHEFAHLRRGDTVVAAIARLVQCVFWFQPFAWWISRQTNELAEMACDAVALGRVGDPAGYSRVLVEFAGAVSRSGQRVALPGLAMASTSRLDERVDHVFALSDGPLRQLSRPGLWLLATGVPVLILASAVVIAAGAPQTPTPAPLPSITFDAVSIKPCRGIPAPGTGRGAAPWSAQISPGYTRWDCVSLYELIHHAYASMHTPLLNNRVIGPNQGDPWLVQGGPDWVTKDRFAVEVRMSGDLPSPNLTGPALNQLRMRAIAPTLQAMLAERFQLTLRRVIGERPMYALQVSKAGLRIKPAVPGDCWDYPPNADGTIPTGSGRGNAMVPEKPAGAGDKPRCGMWTGAAPAPGLRRFVGGSVTFAELALFMSRQMDRWVLDKTGLDGKFTFDFAFIVDDSVSGRGVGASLAIAQMRVPPPAPPAPVDGPTIFETLAKAGLDLVKTNGPAEHFVIDRVQRPRPDTP